MVRSGNHYKVALLPADGHYTLEEKKDQGDDGDLWHAGSALKELGPGPDIRLEIGRDGTSLVSGSLKSHSGRKKHKKKEENAHGTTSSKKNPSEDENQPLQSFPNTDSYHNGEVKSTGIRIFGFSESGVKMTFKVSFSRRAKLLWLAWNENETDTVCIFKSQLAEQSIFE